MRRTLSGFLALALSTVGLAGCGIYSLPRVAAQGSTIVFAVPDGFGSGFGRALNQYISQNPTTDPSALTVDLNPPLEDFQRGEILFALHADASPESAILAYLPVRYITRVHVDEGSSASLPASGETYGVLGTNPQTGQIVALVDIPFSVSPATRYVFMERWRRTPGSTTFEKLSPMQVGSPAVPWRAWAGISNGTPLPADAPMEIRIVAGDTSAFFNDASFGFDKWFGSYSWRNFSTDLDHLTPRPKFRIWIDNPNPPPGTPRTPAAWEITLQYPTGKIEILGAELGTFHRSGGIVTVGATTGATTPCGATGTTKLSAVDPDQKTIWVDVVYRLRDFENCGRAGVNDFTPEPGTLRAYNADGVMLSSPFAYFDNWYSFP